MTLRPDGYTPEQIEKMKETGFYPTHVTVTLPKPSPKWDNHDAHEQTHEHTQD